MMESHIIPTGGEDHPPHEAMNNNMTPITITPEAEAEAEAAAEASETQPASRTRLAIPASLALNRRASTQLRTRKPEKVLESVYSLGQFKAGLGWQYLLVQCFMAGIYKSVGCQTFVTLGGGVLGAVFFPVGLIAIVLTSAELFTGDLMILVVCYFGGKVKMQSVLRNLAMLSWIFNFAGTLLWASLQVGPSKIRIKSNLPFNWPKTSSRISRRDIFWPRALAPTFWSVWPCGRP
jgi:hypothetical protein